MAISASMVKELREETGVGMMECKRALEKANGDKAEAIKLLREAGMALAAKKATRTAKQGMIAATVSADAQSGRMIEVNCETDFVTKNPEFQALVKELLADAEGLEDNGLAAAVKTKMDEKIAKIGENLVARRNISYAVQGTGAIVSYVHLGGKLGVLIEVGFSKPETLADAGVKEFLSDLALHVTATAPICIRREEVPAETVEAERAIYVKQVEGKPANIIDKIVAGKMDKYYSQVCLLEQAFVKDQDVTVAQKMAAVGKAAGDELSIRRFVRWQLGA